MGSWNETCGISNLPIEPGDECVLLYLRENKRSPTRAISRACETWGLWKPVTLPLRGKYADYGRVNLSPDQEHLKATRDWVERCRDKDAWESDRNRLGEDYGFRLNGNAYVPQLYLSSVWDGLRSLHLTPRTDLGTWGQFVAYMTLGNGRYMSHYWRFGPNYQDPYGSKYLEVAWVNYVLMCTRRSWAVTSGSGSQAVDYEAHKALLNLFSEVATTKREEELREYGEDW